MKDMKVESPFPFRRSSSGRSSSNKLDKFADVCLKRTCGTPYIKIPFLHSEDKKPNGRVTKSQSSDDIKRRKFSLPGTSLFRTTSKVLHSDADSCTSSTSSDSSPSSWRRQSFNAILIDDSYHSNCVKKSVGQQEPKSVGNSFFPSRIPKFQETPRLQGLRQKFNNTHNFLNNNRLIPNHQTSTTSWMNQEDEDVVMNTPKIICMHKKTPDLRRKTKMQLAFELELIRKKQNLRKEAESNKLSDKENVIPEENKINTIYRIPDLSLDNDRIPKKNISYFINKNNDIIEESKQETSVIKNSDIKDYKKQCQYASLPYQIGNLSSNTNHPIRQEGFFFCESPSNSVLIEDDESDCELGEIMNISDDSCSFERILEENLENLGEDYGDVDTVQEKDAATTVCSSSKPSVSFKDVHLRKRNKLDLYLDVERTRTLPQKEYLLRKIAEEDSDSATSSPRTPRSPMIDIDDFFESRKKKIGEESRDSMSRVIDLTQRLRLNSPEIPSSPLAGKHLEYIGPNHQKKRESSTCKNYANFNGFSKGTEKLLKLSSLCEIVVEEKPKLKLSESLEWIKNELKLMKEQDQLLAQQFMNLQLEMQRLRLLQSCNQHEALLEEVKYVEDEQKILKTSTLSDVPSDSRDYFAPVLQKFGVTRMNISSRRFSLR